jgi:hypothetical protein
MWASTFHLLQGFLSCQGSIFFWGGGEGERGAWEKLSENFRCNNNGKPLVWSLMKRRARAFILMVKNLSCRNILLQEQYKELERLNYESALI